MILDGLNLSDTNGTIYAITAAVAGITGGLKLASGPIIDIIREWRRPHNSDYQRALHLRSMLSEVYVVVYGTPLYMQIGPQVRKDLEDEFR